jgi:hypothetical protein
MSKEFSLAQWVDHFVVRYYQEAFKSEPASPKLALAMSIPSRLTTNQPLTKRQTKLVVERMRRCLDALTNNVIPEYKKRLSGGLDEAQKPRYNSGKENAEALAEWLRKQIRGLK